MIELLILITLITLIMCFYSNFIAKKLNLIDVPNKSKIHQNSVPITGGLILFFSTAFTFIYQIYFEQEKFFILNSYLLLFFLIGIFDDKFNLNAYIRITFVLLISIFFILSQNDFIIEKIYFEILNSEFYFGKAKIFITLLCILLLYVAMNMADGINGLIIFLSIFSILVLKLIISSNNLNILDISTILTLLILSYFNFTNKLFLGNSGTTLLASYLIFSTIEINYYSQINVFSVISIFLIIGIDMVRLIISRISSKKNPFMRDQNHFHYILLRKFDLLNTNLIYLALSFMPIIFSSILGISVLYFIFISVVFYFLIIFKV